MFNNQPYHKGIFFHRIHHPCKVSIQNKRWYSFPRRRLTRKAQWLRWRLPIIKNAKINCVEIYFLLLWHWWLCWFALYKFLFGCTRKILIKSGIIQAKNGEFDSIVLPEKETKSFFIEIKKQAAMSLKFIAACLCLVEIYFAFGYSVPSKYLAGSSSSTCGKRPTEA